MMLNMLKRSKNPAETVTGADSIRRLQTLTVGKTLVVATPSAQTFGCLNQVMDLLTKGGNAPDSITISSGEPSISIVQGIVKKMRQVKPEWIIALGGGSVIDASKIAWAYYEHPSLDFTCPPPLAVPTLRNKAHFIAIPTTAGSGSESSQAAVLKSDVDHSVMPYVSTEWIPDIVILDPKLTLHLPQNLTAETGMDALSHAVEANVSRLSGLYLKTISGTAIRLILQNLPIVYTQPDNLQARENMLNASYLAGLCQSAVSTGMAHALTHACSAIINSRHGAGNALFLFPTMCLNKEKNNVLYDALAKDAACELNVLFTKIEQLSEQICLPQTLSDISQIPINDSVCSEIANKAIIDVCMRTNPQKPDLEELLTLLKALK